MSSPPIEFPSSSRAGTPNAERINAAARSGALQTPSRATRKSRIHVGNSHLADIFPQRSGPPPATSSPLPFPSSEPGSSGARGHNVSSSTGRPRGRLGASQQFSDASGGMFTSPAIRRVQEPLFFPG